MIERQALLQGGETQFAGVADEDDAARHTDDVGCFLTERQVTPTVADLGQRVSPRNDHRIGLTAFRQQP